jgi:uncharacterized membrane protein YqaE (UPF0057 family)
MKQSKYLFLAIVFAFLFSSCGSLSISQKRYSRGLNIDWFAKKDEAKAAPKAKKIKEPATVVAQTPESNPEELAVIVDNQDVQAPSVEAQNQDVQVSPVKTASVRKTVRRIKSVLKESPVQSNAVSSTAAVSHLKEAVKQNAKPQDVSDNTILLVILSLFPILALIAIYLHEGEINSKFWIDLLLHFLFLYWLFALLVVLDII